jgi:hypothetical protein
MAQTLSIIDGSFTIKTVVVAGFFQSQIGI